MHDVVFCCHAGDREARYDEKRREDKRDGKEERERERERERLFLF